MLRLDELDTVITDDGLSADDLAAARDAGVDVVTAGIAAAAARS